VEDNDALEELLALCEKGIALIEEQQAYETEFINGMIHDVCEVFVKLNENYFEIPFDEFEKACLKDIEMITRILCDDFANLYHHYKDNKPDNFLKMDNISPVVPELEMDQKEIDYLYKLFPPERYDEVEEIIVERKVEIAAELHYYSTFSKVIKSFVAEYIVDADFFPSRAYRELELLCNLYFHDIEGEIYEIAKKVGKEKTDA